MEPVTIRRHLDLDCPPADLWRLVSTPELLGSWLAQEVELEVRPGGLGRLRDDDGALRLLQVHDVVEGRRLSFSWWPEGDEGSVTEVVLAVEETERGSRLSITETADERTAAALTGSWDARIISLWLAVCTQAAV